MNLPTTSTAFSVADVMQTDVYTLSPETPVGAARRLADGKHVNHLVVVEHQMLAGILCKDDLSSADQASTVRECMTTPVPCVAPETTLRDAAGIMHQHSLTCLAVVMGALLVGIITRAELVELGLAQAERPAPEPWRQRPSADGACVGCGSRYAVFANAAALETPLCRACSSRVSRSTSRPLA